MMTTLDALPLPDCPDYFGPDGAPPGVDLLLDAYETLDDGFPWLRSRPIIAPRLAVVHTNAASSEGTVQSAINWGRSDANRTKPHYCVNQPTPTKTLATDRRSIANSTPAWMEEQYGEQDVSFWSISIETADMGVMAAQAAGYPSGDLGPFLVDSVYGPVKVPHAEIVARILAYESIVWGFPLEVPDVWNGSGIVTHTWPHEGYTTVAGKTCPGATKVDEFRTEIVPRARAIFDHWTKEDAPMLDTAVLWRDTRFAGTYLIGAGAPLILSPELRDHYRALGVPEVDGAHDALLANLERATGYTPRPR